MEVCIGYGAIEAEARGHMGLTEYESVEHLRMAHHTARQISSLCR